MVSRDSKISARILNRVVFGGTQILGVQSRASGISSLVTAMTRIGLEIPNEGVGGSVGVGASIEGIPVGERLGTLLGGEDGELDGMPDGKVLGFKFSMIFVGEKLGVSLGTP
jgi:hypothetical protein